MRLRKSEIVVGFLHYLKKKKKKKKDGNIIIDKYKLNEKNLNCSQTNLDNNNNNQNKSTKHRKVIKETTVWFHQIKKNRQQPSIFCVFG